MNTRIDAREIEKARAEFLQKTLKALRVPTSRSRLVFPFRKWCRRNGINPDTQTLSGKNFKAFWNEKKQESARACERLNSVIQLFKFVSPLWTSGEAVQEANEIIGWNACFMEYVKDDAKLTARNEASGNPYEHAKAVGYNQALRKLHEHLEREKKL